MGSTWPVGGGNVLLLQAPEQVPQPEVIHTNLLRPPAALPARLAHEVRVAAQTRQSRRYLPRAQGFEHGARLARYFLRGWGWEGVWSGSFDRLCV